MIDLEQKALEVSLLMQKLDEEIAAFQSWSTLHCLPGCGKCCFKADIEATILEFIPFALYLYQHQKAETWLLKLEKTTSTICLILNPMQEGAGLCSEYEYRGLICRLFGYSARTNKHGIHELITCQIIKTEQAESFVAAEQRIGSGEPVPVMAQFYMRLSSIDFELTREFYPINEAIKKAIQTVLQYFSYR